MKNFGFGFMRLPFRDDKVDIGLVRHIRKQGIVFAAISAKSIVRSTSRSPDISRRSPKNLTAFRDGDKTGSGESWRLQHKNKNRQVLLMITRLVCFFVRISTRIVVKIPAKQK